MASINRTVNGRWKARIRLRGTSVARTFSTRHAATVWAKRKEREIEQDMAYGHAYSALMRTSMADLCRQYLDTHKGKDRSRIGRVQWWIDTLGDRNILDIDKQVIRKALDDYAAGHVLIKTADGVVHDTGQLRSPASVNRLQAAASAVFQFGRLHLDLPRNPCREVQARPEPRVSERFLTREEVSRLLLACRESRWERLYLLVLMALNTGARRGELEKLRWGDIDWEHRTAILRDTKNATDRVLTLSDEVMAELSAHSGKEETVINLQAHRYRDRELVFSKRRPLVPCAFDGEFRAAWRRAGLSPLRFHDLRHTAASLLAQDGHSLYEIGNVLGHKNLATTQRYAHFCVESKRRITDASLGNLTHGGNEHD